MEPDHPNGENMAPASWNRKQRGRYRKAMEDERVAFIREVKTAGFPFQIIRSVAGKPIGAAIGPKQARVWFYYATHGFHGAYKGSGIPALRERLGLN